MMAHYHSTPSQRRHNREYQRRHPEINRRRYHANKERWLENVRERRENLDRMTAENFKAVKDDPESLFV